MKLAFRLLTNRYMLALGGLLLAALLFASAGLVGQVVMVLVAVAIVYGYRRKRGEDAGVLLGALGWCANALATFGALLATTRWGRWAGGTLAVLMLADASWGDDGVGLPLIGWPLGVVVALAVGGREWAKRRPYVERVEDAVREAVLGYTRTQLPQVTFGEGPGARFLGRYQPAGAFSFPIPTALRKSGMAETDQHLREALQPTVAEGSTWTFDWDMRSGRCRGRVAPDLPKMVWHPAADGSMGNPLAPLGDPFVVPMGIELGNIVKYWNVTKNPHMLAVGTTGGGKSGVAYTLLLWLLLHRSSWEIRLIDPKFSEFGKWANYPGAVDGVALTLPESLEMLELAKAEMLERQQALLYYQVQDIKGLNKALAAENIPELRRSMTLIDEIGELLDRTGGRSPEAKEADELRGECSSIFDSIARLGRAMGVHLFYATQRNDATVISGQTRNNTQARIAVGSLTNTASHMALENDLATGLSGDPGHGIFYEFGRCTEFQVFLTKEENILDMIGVPA